MRILKLTAIAGLILCSSLVLSSCEKENVSPQVVSNSNIIMSRSNNVPNTVNSSGRIEASFDKKSHILSYKVTWEGLTSNPLAIHLHGIADAGQIALPQPIGLFPSGVAQNITGFSNQRAGSLTGSVFVDNVAIREADILAGKFYMDIHTANYATAAHPAGEIRGQITFNQ